MKIFDTHTHVYPDKIAERCLAHLSKISGDLPTYTLGTYDDLYQRAIDAGYTGWMNCPVATKPGQAASLNLWASQHNTWPSLSLGSFHPDDASVVDEVKRIMDLGLHGLKLHPEYQEFALTDKRMTPVWEYCENHSIPILFHSSNDVGFPPPYHTRPRDFAELVRRYEGLIVVAAHTGGWLCWDEVERDLAGANVYIDTSFTLKYLKDKSQFDRILRKHGMKKVLYGTDSPWQELKHAIAEIQERGFSQEETEDIFWNNAARLWKLDAFAK